MTSYRFDLDTAGSVQADGTTAVNLSADWNVDGRILNGGYVQAVIVRASQAALEAGGAAASLVPVVVSTTFASPAAPGPATVHVDVLRGGGRLTAVSSTLRQGAGAVATSLVTFAVREFAAAPGASTPAMPSATPAAQSIRVPTNQLPGPPGLAELIDYRFVPENSAWLTGDTSAGPHIRCWLSFADGRPLDALAATALMDIAPPVCFATGNFGWAPTLQLQVGLFGQPIAGPVLLDLVGEPYSGPVVAEDGLLWDSAGTLIARSRQIALAPRG